MTIVGYLFGLPQQFFDSSTVSGEAAQADAASVAPRQLPAATATQSQARPPEATGWRESGATCLTCGIGVSGPGFSNAQEQREHFKTDWHRYNVKRRLAKQPAVSEEQFEKVLEQGTELSISGSESESSDEDGEDGGEEGGAGGQAMGADGAPARGRGRKGQQAPLAIPRETFQAADGSLFSVWRCLLRQDHVKAAADQPTSPPELLAELRRLRSGCGTWAVVLLRGGHFAATVFKARSAPAPSGAKHDADGLEGFDVVAHKTFHRYVVRAKAGGKQSSKDATGKFARSAGSRLRRYNEAALERDVQELLSSWSAHLASADLVFVHAPASNARSLFSEGQTTLLPSNPRLRRVPFVTHRPTFSETKRVLRLLTAVFRPEAAEQLLAAQHAEHAAEEAEAAAAAAAALAASSLGPHNPAPEGHRPAPEIDAAAGPSVSSADTSAGPSHSQQQQHQQQPQPQQHEPHSQQAQQQAGGAEGQLHKAAKAGDPDRVRRLLESGHDPCARDAKGRTPYALAADKDTRDAFRRFMAQQPGRWDYAAAGIPSPLTEEMEAAQQAKKAAHKAKLKAKDAERKGPKAEGSAGSSEDQRRAAAAAAEAARKQAVEDEIAQAAAEAAAIAARMHASSKPPSSSARAHGAGGSKVGGGGGGGKAGKSAGGKGAAAAAAAQPAAAPTPEELERRREMMAAAAEARMRALSQAAQQQKLW